MSRTKKLTVRGVRKALGLTQEEMGHLMGVTSRTINRWENGRTDSTPPYQWGLLQAFAVAAMHPGTAELLAVELATHGPIVALASLLRVGITNGKVETT